MGLKTVKGFRRKVREHYRRYGRDLPWRPPSLKLRKDKTLDPYKILVSEIMLQQTQVRRVEKFYPMFLEKFPNFKALARAPLRAVLTAWQGLGYNRRALNLQRAARIIVGEHGGKLPDEPALLARLPGVGKATACSIAAFAFNKPAAFIETNIRRAFIHHFFPRRRNVRDKEIMALARAALDKKDSRRWHWALMDYGAYLAVALRQAQGAGANPNRRSAHYTRQAPFSGSSRELRGRIVALLAKGIPAKPQIIARRLRQPPGKVKEILTALAREGFLGR